MQLLLKTILLGWQIIFDLFIIYLLFEWSLYRMSRDVSFMNSAPFTHTLKSDCILILILR